MVLEVQEQSPWLFKLDICRGIRREDPRPVFKPPLPFQVQGHDSQIRHGRGQFCAS